MSKLPAGLSKLRTFATECIENLEDFQLEHVVKLMERLREPVEGELFRNDFIDEMAFSYIKYRLSAHHATSISPLKKENFEDILALTFRKLGRDVPERGAQNHRGADIQVDGRGYSLKTTGTKEKLKIADDADLPVLRGLLPNDVSMPRRIDISKFAEARWIREPLLAGDFVTLKVMMDNSIGTHIVEYEKIFMLHNHLYFWNNMSFVRYELREIPKSLIEYALHIPAQQLEYNFRQEDDRRRQHHGDQYRRAQNVTAWVHPPGYAVVGRTQKSRLYSLSLDGSVEKLRVMGIDRDSCPLHAWWTLRAPDYLDRSN